MAQPNTLTAACRSQVSTPLSARCPKIPTDQTVAQMLVLSGCTDTGEPQNNLTIWKQVRDDWQVLEYIVSPKGFITASKHLQEIMQRKAGEGREIEPVLCALNNRCPKRIWILENSKNGHFAVVGSEDLFSLFDSTPLAGQCHEHERRKVEMIDEHRLKLTTARSLLDLSTSKFLHDLDPTDVGDLHFRAINEDYERAMALHPTLKKNAKNLHRVVKELTRFRFETEQTGVHLVSQAFFDESMQTLDRIRAGAPVLPDACVKVFELHQQLCSIDGEKYTELIRNHSARVWIGAWLAMQMGVSSTPVVFDFDGMNGSLTRAFSHVAPQKEIKVVNDPVLLRQAHCIIAPFGLRRMNQNSVVCLFELAGQSTTATQETPYIVLVEDTQYHQDETIEAILQQSGQYKHVMRKSHISFEVGPTVRRWIRFHAPTLGQEVISECANGVHITVLQRLSGGRSGSNGGIESLERIHENENNTEIGARLEVHRLAVINYLFSVSSEGIYVSNALVAREAIDSDRLYRDFEHAMTSLLWSQDLYGKERCLSSDQCARINKVCAEWDIPETPVLLKRDALFILEAAAKAVIPLNEVPQNILDRIHADPEQESISLMELFTKYRRSLPRGSQMYLEPLRSKRAILKMDILDGCHAIAAAEEDGLATVKRLTRHFGYVSATGFRALLGRFGLGPEFLNSVIDFADEGWLTVKGYIAHHQEQSNNFDLIQKMLDTMYALHLEQAPEDTHWKQKKVHPTLGKVETFYHPTLIERVHQELTHGEDAIRIRELASQNGVDVETIKKMLRGKPEAAKLHLHKKHTWLESDTAEQITREVESRRAVPEVPKNWRTATAWSQHFGCRHTVFARGLNAVLNEKREDSTIDLDAYKKENIILGRPDDTIRVRSYISPGLAELVGARITEMQRDKARIEREALESLTSFITSYNTNRNTVYRIVKEADISSIRLRIAVDGFGSYLTPTDAARLHGLLAARK